jgi:hypothetical protein
MSPFLRWVINGIAATRDRPLTSKVGSIEQAVCSCAFRFREVNGKSAPEQLPGSLRATDDTGSFGVRENSAVAICFTLDGSDAMERVTSAKEKQIAGLKHDTLNELATAAL